MGIGRSFYYRSNPSSVIQEKLEKQVLEEIRKQIENHIMSDPDLHQPFALRMSLAGDCPRKIDYSFQRPKEAVGLDSALRFSMGHGVHHQWSELIHGLFGDDCILAEAEISLDMVVDGETIKLIGHPDFFLKSLGLVGEVKSVSDSTYTMIINKNAPLDAYVDQGSLYCMAISKTAPVNGILFIVVNRDSGAFKLFIENFDSARAISVLHKFEQALRNKKSGTIGPRPYVDMTDSPCWYCRFKIECYEGFKDAVTGMATKVNTDSVFTVLARTYADDRRRKLLYEKHEANVKRDIAIYMVDNEVNKLTVDQVGTVELKIGVNNNALVGLKEEKK